MSDNPGPSLIRALKLPLRDVHDVCSTGDLEYLLAFAKDESHRAEKGLGRAYSPSRKTTAPVRRAEILQGSKIAEKAEQIAEKKELRTRQKKKDAAKARRLAEAEAEARAESGADDYESEHDSQGPLTPMNDRLGGTAAPGDDHDDARTESTNYSDAAIKNPLLASGAGATDNDKVSHLQVFPRPRLGQTQSAATEEAIFNTVGLGVVTMYDLINFRDEHGFLPIHTACIFGHGNVVEFLLENGADIESQVPTTLYRPLHLAVLNGHDALARKLVETFNADPGALTAKFELPLTLARRRRAAVEQLFYKEKCLTRIQSTNALDAARTGDVLFFAYHIESDISPNGEQVKKLFNDTAAFKQARAAFSSANPDDDASNSNGTATPEAVFRDPVSTPLDVAIASCTQKEINDFGVTSPFFTIAKLLLAGKYYNLNELRESSIATTTLYLAVSIPVAREAIKLLLGSGSADPRVASTYNAAPNQITKFILAEAEAKVIFDETYAKRDEVEFSERQEFIHKIAELRTKWKMAGHKLQKALDREEAMNAASSE